jgi:hypothetical protein
MCVRRITNRKNIIDHAAHDERAAAGSKVGLAVFNAFRALFTCHSPNWTYSRLS